MRWPGQVVRYGAQTGLDARAMLADTWWPRLEHSPLAEVLSFRRQSGHEALIFENGSRLGLLASTEKSAHGSTLDMAVLDERRTPITGSSRAAAQRWSRGRTRRCTS